MEKVRILASKDATGAYRADEIVPDMDNFLAGLEYGDVAEGELQIWDYPSGEVYDIVPDREVSNEKNYYALPSPDLWEPTLKHVNLDKKTVEAAYLKLTNPPRSFFGKIFGGGRKKTES